MRSLPTDVRHALRGLRRNPGFTAAALLTLALGIGANTAIFSVVHGILLRPLPYEEPSELVHVWLNNPAQGIERDVTSYPIFRDWREELDSFEALAGGARITQALTGEGRPEQVRGALVTRGWFDLLGVPMADGRAFVAEEHDAGGPRVVVLSQGLASRRFGDASAAGRTVRLDGEAHTVVGVMPPGEAYPPGAEFWRPLAFEGGLADLEEARSSFWLPVIGRLRDGVSLQRAQVEASGVAARLADAYPDAIPEGAGIFLEGLQESLVGEVRPALLVLLGAVGLVLLVACANVGNLLLARGTRRRRELAVRAALGAGSGRLLRQALTESVLLALLGGTAGAVLAAGGVEALVRLAPPDLPRLGQVGVNVPVLAFTLGLSVLAGLLFGLAPALRLLGRDLWEALREGGRSDAAGGEGRLRPAFLAAQVALALVLMVGAGLLLRSFLGLQRVDPGFEPRGLLAFQVDLSGAGYGDEEARRAFHRRLLTELEATPGVRSAAVVTELFLDRLPRSAPVSVAGRPDMSEADRNLPVAFDGATPGLFRTLGVRLLGGRTFETGDDADAAPLAVVNDAFARRFFPEGSAVGGRFVFGDRAEDEPWIRIVGVVADARRSGLDRPARPSIYFPLAQYTPPVATVVVRTDGNPLSVAGTARAAVALLDPALPVVDLRTVEQALAGSIARPRFLLVLIGGFATLALLLACVGIYGVVAYTVGRRRREIGIRMALGASRRAVVGLVLRETTRPLAAGVGAGLVGALALTGLLEHVLYGVPPRDVMTFLAVAAVLSAVALAAAWLPARRAAAVDPNVALRAE